MFWCLEAANEDVAIKLLAVAEAAGFQWLPVNHHTREDRHGHREDAADIHGLRPDLQQNGGEPFTKLSPGGACILGAQLFELFGFESANTWSSLRHPAENYATAKVQKLVL